MVDIASFRQKCQSTIAHTKESMGTIRTGRASPVLVERIPVTTYGGQATLKVMELATITTDGPQDLLIMPFDPSVLQDIENALRNAQIGFIVAVQGSAIRVKNPPLSSEQREKYAKLVSQYAEEGREQMRRERDEIRKAIKEQFDAKEMSEDQKYRQEEEIDKLTKTFTDSIDQMRENKQREVMTI